MRTLSLDLRERILVSYDNEEGTREEVAERYRVSLGMVKKLLQQRRRTGEIGARHHRSGRKPVIVALHQRKMRILLGQKPDLTLKELRAAVELECSLPAIHYALEKMGLTYKKDTPGQRARSPRHRAGAPGVASASSRLRPRQAGLPRRVGGENQPDKACVAAPRFGKRVHASSPHGHWHTTTMISSIRLDGSTACMTIDGATDTEVFRVYVRRVLSPTLRKGDLVILDNLSPHKSNLTLSLIEQAGAEVLFFARLLSRLQSD